LDRLLFDQRSPVQGRPDGGRDREQPVIHAVAADEMQAGSVTANFTDSLV